MKKKKSWQKESLENMSEKMFAWTRLLECRIQRATSKRTERDTRRDERQTGRNSHLCLQLHRLFERKFMIWLIVGAHVEHGRDKESERKFQRAKKVGCIQFGWWTKWSCHIQWTESERERETFNARYIYAMWKYPARQILIRSKHFSSFFPAFPFYVPFQWMVENVWVSLSHSHLAWNII